MGNKRHIREQTRIKRIVRAGDTRDTGKASEKSFTIEQESVSKRYGLLETRKSSKSVRGMPRLSEAKKDVTSCDKLGGGANGL